MISMTAKREVYQLLYRSQAAGDILKELPSILAASRRNNPSRGISGLLIYRDGYFLQLLEGPEDQVAERFAVIMRDPRHEGVELLARIRNGEAIFGDWAMGFLEESSQPSNVEVDVLNKLHNFALRNAKPVDNRTIISILSSFKTGCRDLSQELPRSS